jgi:hypothetical protein
MKNLKNIIIISGLFIATANASYAFDISNIKNIFFKSQAPTTAESKVEMNTRVMTEIAPMSAISEPTNTNSTTSINIISTSTISASSSTVTKDTEIKNTDTCTVKKVKLNAKKDNVIKVSKQQKEDISKINITLVTVIENSDSEEDSKLISAKLETLNKEVGDVEEKQKEIVSTISSTTQMQCVNKNFDNNITKIKKLEAENKIQLAEVKDFLQNDLKETLRSIER